VYGLDSNKVYSESDVPVVKGQENFFTDLCKKWEESSQLPEGSQTRVVNPRFGKFIALSDLQDLVYQI
jgi:NAD dependent epimerase/dehydratase family enzyme